MGTQEFIHLDMLSISHPDEEEMAVLPCEFVDLGEIVAAVVCFPEDARQLALDEARRRVQLSNS